MAAHTPTLTTYGLMAEFKTPEALLEAATRTYADGYQRIEAFSPFPVHGLAEALGHRDRTVQISVLFGGFVGLLAGLSLCYYTSGMEITALPAMFSGYVHNIGGRPVNSWPAFIVPTFETTILFAGITSLVSMLIANGLPMPYHPVFNVERFRQHASTDGFFLCIEAADPRFDPQQTRRYLEGLGASEVNDVAN